jgi:hypothetical protein
MQCVILLVADYASAWNEGNVRFLSPSGEPVSTTVPGSSGWSFCLAGSRPPALERLIEDRFRTLPANHGGEQLPLTVSAQLHRVE